MTAGIPEHGEQPGRGAEDRGCQLGGHGGGAGGRGTGPGVPHQACPPLNAWTSVPRRPAVLSTALSPPWKAVLRAG